MREPVSGLLHAVGVVFGCVGFVFLVDLAIQRDSLIQLVAFVIYGLSFIALFVSSTLYHLWPTSADNVKKLRKFDHMMIFVFISSSYTPFCLISLRGIAGWSLLALVWVITLSGIFMKIFWMDAPRWFYTLLYVLMGWIAVFVFYPLSRSLPSVALGGLIAGGLFYTVGAVIYARKWPDPWPPHFGFHEIWHVFVLSGALVHFWTIYHFVN